MSADDTGTDDASTHEFQRRELLGAIAAVAGSSVAASVASADHGDDLVAQMSLSDKVHLTHGDNPDRYVTGAIESLDQYGFPTTVMYDGPVGVRSGEPQTAFPASILAAASFDTDLMYEQGVAMGKETKAAGAHVLLGPALNLHRNPKCGRNFEYYTEDPYLNGEMAAASTAGIQSEDVVATPKHFVANHQEHERRNLNADIPERALRELYLPGFRKAVQEGGALSVMSAYNAVNGDNCTGNEWLLTDVLRDDWGFEGYVVTDWGAIQDTVDAALAGTDVDMDGSGPGFSLYPYELEDAVRSGQVPESQLDEMAGNVLHAFGETGHLDGDIGSGEENTSEHQELSREFAESGAVLLKNDDVLPIDLDEVDSIAVLGQTANEPIVGGGGAAEVDPPHDATVSALEGIENYVGGQAEVIHESWDGSRAADADVALAFGHVDSSEFSDRSDLSLESGGDVIQQAADANPNTVAVLRIPGPVEMPWLDDVAGVLNMWYPGMRDGEATANLLFGETNPSGKLPTTFAREDQYPTSVEQSRQITYDEGLSVGYRYFDEADVDPTFEFGFGLSYTEFEYSNLQHPDAVQIDGTAEVSVDVTNVGDHAGAETVQVYVEQLNPSVERPPKELKGFDKVHVDPGETATATVELDREAFEYWHPDDREWTVEEDEFRLHVAASSRDVRQTGTIAVGQEPEPTCGDDPDAEALEVDGQTVCNVDGDDYFRDVNGDGRVGNRDVGAFFENFHFDAWDRDEFDYSGNGRVSHGDVVALFDYVV